VGEQLKDGSRAVVLFNRAARGEDHCSLGSVGISDHLNASVRDLWRHKDLGKFTGTFSSSVASHGVMMVTVKP